MGPSSLTAGQPLVRLPGRMCRGRVDVRREGWDRAHRAADKAKAEALRTTAEEPSICLKREEQMRPLNHGDWRVQSAGVGIYGCCILGPNLTSV